MRAWIEIRETDFRYSGPNGYFWLLRDRKNKIVIIDQKIYANKGKAVRGFLRTLRLMASAEIRKAGIAGKGGK